ncbi:glycosyltransferase [Thiorhodovibrio frisius]|uniref:Glycosyltransferase n=1 Tax=Thiorhodovibrio frisius TaxID=631362 RepID=H8Z4N3_9GAMM|nr:glycosyltransferase [Thiorhodovibrio frisius]EIC20290.1 glycosyltransferase [Thiorhodovibrio frisius]WPL21027.1 GDP-mannose-dependent alpha-(1-6)-phosphatidylinositol monomannoside mannosyltransferase [Thiorhodovibrio frisius]
MRVLHVEGGARLYGGALQLLYLLRGLAARGIDNHLACRTDCELAVRAQPFARVEPMSMHGDADLLLIPRLRKLIARTRPDIVHLHSRIGADVMGGVAGRLAGVPVVHTRRVDNPEPRWLAAVKYRLHDRVIAISAGIADVLRGAGVPESKLRLVRSAVDTQAYAQPCDKAYFDAQLGLNGAGSAAKAAQEAVTDAPVIGVVAQLIARKGHGVLLEALPGLVTRWPGLQVFFFGRGREEGALRAQIAALGLAQHVRLVGFRDDLDRLLPCLDLLVHPATMEGLGVSLLQAAAAAVPVIASRAGGIPEAVLDGETGLLVPPGDVAALQAAIAGLLADAAQRMRFGKAGRARMLAEFSLDAMVEGNLAVYRELLSAGCSAWKDSQG